MFWWKILWRLLQWKCGICNIVLLKFILNIQHNMGLLSISLYCTHRRSCVNHLMFDDGKQNTINYAWIKTKRNVIKFGGNWRVLFSHSDKKEIFASTIPFVSTFDIYDLWNTLIFLWEYFEPIMKAIWVDIKNLFCMKSVLKVLGPLLGQNWPYFRLVFISSSLRIFGKY